jgi:hypothetical protein
VPVLATPMQTGAKWNELRQLLAARVPAARLGWARTPATPRRSTGLRSLDHALGGGLLTGEITELVGSSSGSAQVIHALLTQTAADGRFIALVDGIDSLDADAVRQEVLQHLLWVRCTDADEALKATDLLLRDRNFPLVVLDLKMNPVAQLRRIPNTTWYRLSRLLEASGATVLAVTPTPTISGVAVRVQVSARLDLSTWTGGDVRRELHFEPLRTISDEESMARVA